MSDPIKELPDRLQALMESYKKTQANAEQANESLKAFEKLASGIGPNLPRQDSDGVTRIKNALKELEKQKADNRRITDGKASSEMKAIPVLLDELVNLKYTTVRTGEFIAPFGFWMIGPGVPEAQIIRYARNEDEAIALIAAQWFRAKEKNLDICFNKPVGRVLKALEKIHPPTDKPMSQPDYDEGGSF